MTILKKTFCGFLFFLSHAHIKTSNDYPQEYATEEETTPLIEEQASIASPVQNQITPTAEESTDSQIINKLKEKNKTIEKEIAERQADLEKQNKTKKEQKQNPALASKIKNDKIAIEKKRKQIAYNNEQIKLLLQKAKSEQSNILGKFNSKKNKKRKPYCNPKITL